MKQEKKESPQDKQKNAERRGAGRRGAGRRAARYAAQGATVAALYVALTALCAVAGLSSMAVQVRVAEALCVLPYYLPAAVPGLFVGCLVANLLTGAVMWDVVFGSLATLLGALGARGLARLAKRAEGAGHSRRAQLLRGCIPAPTVLSNTLIVPLVLKYAYSLPDLLPLLFLSVGVGELISAWVLGLLLLRALRRVQKA